MSEDFEREERAFADALRKDAPVEAFRPLDPEAVRAAAGPGVRSGRPRWLKGLAAAAAVVVVVGAGAAILPGLVGGSASSVSGMPEVYPASGAASMDAQDRASAAAGPGPVSKLSEWSLTSGMPLTPRSNAAGAWLNGEFYVVGGQSDPPCPPNASCVAPDQLLKDAAAYNPATNTWRRIADAPVALSGGNPVVVGGWLYLQRDYGPDGKVYAYDTTTDVWLQLPSPAGGGVLVALGDRLAGVAWSTEEAGTFDELLDPATGQWTRLPADPLKASYERTLVWVNGRGLLFAKDVRTQSSARAPVFRVAELDLSAGRWRTLPDTDVVGVGGLAVGDLVVFPEPGSYDGGEADNWGRSYPAGGIYDPASGKWSRLPGPARWADGLSVMGSSVAGVRMLGNGRLLDPVERTWTTVPAPPAGNLLGQTVVAGPDGILLFGGWDGKAPTAGSAYLPLR